MMIVYFYKKHGRIGQKEKQVPNLLNMPEKKSFFCLMLKGFCPCEATHARADASNTVREPWMSSIIQVDPVHLTTSTFPQDLAAYHKP